MEIRINENDPMPLFNQLIAQIKSAVERGQLRPGMPLPAIRQLANDLMINPNTVAKAYRLLERDSVVETRGYRGTFIHPQAHANCARNLAEEARERMQGCVGALREQGLTDSEIRIAFNQVIKQ